MVTSPSIVLTANDVHVFYKIQVDVHHAIDFNVFSIQCNIRNSVFKPGPCNMKFSYHKLYIILLSVSFWHATSYLFIHGIKKQIGSRKTEVTEKKMEDMAVFFIRKDIFKVFSSFNRILTMDIHNYINKAYFWSFLILLSLRI